MVRFGALAALALAGCGDSRTSYERGAEEAAAVASAQVQPAPAEVAEAEAKRAKEVARQDRIDAIRRADPALDWVNIGISTSKFSESLHGSVHKTFDECEKSSWMEDNECVPIPALPDSYWDAADVE